jgi:hypothetical protein
VTTLGGTTISAGLIDSQAQLDQAIGVVSASGTDSLTQFADAYRASGGGPSLAFLGFNPFQFVATGAFHELYWSAIVIFLGVMTVLAMQNAIRHTVRGRYPLDSLAQVYFRLAAGILIVGNLPLLYAILMTVNSVASQGIQAIAAQSMGRLFQTGSLGTLTLAQARIEAIRSAAARRTMALYPAGASREEMIQIGTWYNAMAGAINPALAAQNLPGQLPSMDPGVWTNAQTPDDRVAAYVGRNVVQNFGQMLADLGALPASGSGGLSVAFPAGGSTPLGLLSASLAGDDAQAVQALNLPNTPSSSSQFEAARQAYARNVTADSLTYLDDQVLPTLNASPTLAQRAGEWFAEKVEQAASAATGFLTDLRSAVDWLGRGIGLTLTRILAFLFTAATKVLIEIDLFVLVLAMPLWLLPATEDAFYGVLRALFALSLAAPAYQFIMLFVDALMGLVLNYVIFGPFASGNGGPLQAGGGAAYLAASAVAAVGSGGETVALAMFCYIAAYAFLAVYAALKTPKLVAVFLKGAGAGGAFLSTFATGLIAGAATALATSAVGGSSLAGVLLGSGPAPRGPGGVVRREPVFAVSNPSPSGGGTGSGRRPALGRLAASGENSNPEAGRPAPSPVRTSPADPGGQARPGQRYAEAAGFGLRTFAEGLRSTHPGEGFRIAVRALEEHRKQQEKAAEARYKLQRSAERTAATASGRRSSPDA